MISEEVLFDIQLAKTVMAALRGHYSDLGQTRILDIAGINQNKDSIEGMAFITPLDYNLVPPIILGLYSRWVDMGP